MRDVDMPSPDRLRPRWAAFAAVLAGRGPRWAEGAHASADAWHYDDGGGNWVDLCVTPVGHAVLVGHDHEYSETYFRDAAEYFEEQHTDLLAGTPAWWSATIAPYLDDITGQGVWIGFIYGFDGSSWSRADYDAEDGFSSLRLPFVSDERTVEQITMHLSRAAPGPELDVSAVQALVAAGPAVDRATLDAVFKGRELDAGAALAAARGFA
ncbi:MAG: hypothetical protein C0482_11435 [Gordonia sp.]|nr:hypothetical protein [Gordonia sp. (in: high G+C Gram-positive bacteria)]